MTLVSGGETEEEPEIDRFRPGYPRYSALVTTNTGFQVYRRFTRIRTRILLQAQFKVATLENELDKLDAAEKNPLCLGSLEREFNEERVRTLVQLKNALQEYDTQLEWSRRWLTLPTAKKQDVQSLRNWVEGTGSVPRSEAAYLQCDNDLFNLAGIEYSAVSRIETTLSSFFAWLHGHLGKTFRRCLFRHRKNITTDEHIFIFSSLLTALSRTIISLVATTILVAPILTLEFLSTRTLVRLLVIVISSGAFVLAVTLLAKARTVEVLAAGAAYAAVVVSFTNSSTNSRLVVLERS